jgi:hypothetical protein
MHMLLLFNSLMIDRPLILCTNCFRTDELVFTMSYSDVYAERWGRTWFVVQNSLQGTQSYSDVLHERYEGFKASATIFISATCSERRRYGS